MVGRMRAKVNQPAELLCSRLSRARVGVAPLLHSFRSQGERDVAGVLYRVSEMAATEKLETGMLERALRDNECVPRPPVWLDDEHLGRLGRVEIVVVATASEFPFQKLTDKPQLAVVDWGPWPWFLVDHWSCRVARHVPQQAR
jgi:hypothetical protein